MLGKRDAGVTLSDRGGKLGGFGERRERPHPAEPGLACTKPARSDSEAGGEMHHSEPGVGVSPGQQQWWQLLRRVTQGQLKGLEPGAVSDSGAQGGNGGRGE